MSFIIFLFVIRSAASTKTIITSLDIYIYENTYENEMVAYLHVMWPNHGKVIKTTAPKVALMKGIHLNRPHDLWLHDILTKWKEHVVTFTKAFRHQIRYKKNTEYSNLFFRFKINMTNAASWNELKLLRG